MADAEDNTSTADLVQALAPFGTVIEGGVTVLVKVNDVYRKSDPVYAASPISFREIQVLDSAVYRRPFTSGRRTAVAEEVPTSAPAERRAVTRPVDPPATAPTEAPGKASAGRVTTAAKKPAPAGAGPSEV